VRGGAAAPHHVVNGVNGNAAGPIVPAAPETPPQPANPVTVLHDVYGDRMASGSFRGGETAIVYTTTNLQQAMSADPGPAGFTVDDSDAVVLGNGFWIDVSAGTYWGAGGNILTRFIVKPSVIAQRVHGHVLGAAS
jgi:hypothetical protein